MYKAIIPPTTNTKISDWLARYGPDTGFGGKVDYGLKVRPEHILAGDYEGKTGESNLMARSERARRLTEGGGFDGQLLKGQSTILVTNPALLL